MTEAEQAEVWQRYADGANETHAQVRWDQTEAAVCLAGTVVAG